MTVDCHFLFPALTSDKVSYASSYSTSLVSCEASVSVEFCAYRILDAREMRRVFFFFFRSRLNFRAVKL